MPPFIQQPHSLYYSPARIPTFDHGLQQTVYVRRKVVFLVQLKLLLIGVFLSYSPVNRFGDRLGLSQFWYLRKAGGLKWEYYCSCTPPADSPGIPARFYEVTKITSPYFGNAYLACGKTKRRDCCTWKIRLDKIYKAQDVEIRIQPSDTSDGDSESSSDPPAEEGSHIENKDTDVRPPASSPRVPSAPLDAEDHDFNNAQFDEAFAQLMAQLQIAGELPSSFPPFSEQELAELLEQLGLNREDPLAAAPSSSDPPSHQMVWNEMEEEWQLPARAYEGKVFRPSVVLHVSLTMYLELCAAFAGQDDVLVTPDGEIHYIPKDPQSSATIAEEANTFEENADDMRWEDNGEVFFAVANVRKTNEVSETTLIEEPGPILKTKPSASESFDSQEEMFVDLTLDEDQLPPREPITRFLSPIDLTIDELTQDGLKMVGAGTCAEPYKFSDL
ncbi:hypothetical protein EV361DRAFT_873205 [Lentinula raphanica]|nr:hypothetical protein EV361DRAFT_873205 [Lentinula raphanica]